MWIAFVLVALAYQQPAASPSAVQLGPFASRLACERALQELQEKSKRTTTPKAWDVFYSQCLPLSEDAGKGRK